MELFLFTKSDPDFVSVLFPAEGMAVIYVSGQFAIDEAAILVVLHRVVPH